MKRKYLSALLMGVLTLSSVSTFTSCKDYDDDISNLQEQIDKLATADQLSQKVAELQALISSNKSDITSLQTKVAEALTAAQKAQTTADSKATLDEVKAELEKYATKDEVATVKATLEAAQKALEEKNDAALKDAVQKAQEAADKAVADAKAAVEEVKTDLASYKTTVASEQEVVNAALATLNTKVDAKADTTALNNAIATLTAADANAKAEILSEIASKYATKEQADKTDAALKEFVNKIEKQLGDYAKTAEVQKLLAELKKNADVTYAAKEEIKNLQTKEAVEEAINNAIGALKKGDLAAVNKIAKEALEKANKAESEKGLAYLKALAAEGAAADAAKDAKAADAKAVQNQKDIKNIQDALGAGFDAKNTVAKAIQLINDQLTAKNTGLSGLNARLESIESKLKLEDPDKSLVERVNKIDKQLQDIIGEYTTMVTEVSLVGSFLNTGGLSALGNTQLDFVSGTVAQNITFGKAEKDDKGVEVPSATNQQAFVKGTTFNNKKEILVRVNPTNAVLTKASIKLVDSQGNNLDNILEIGEPKKYDELLTRGSNNTGLWTIPVTVKDGVAKGDIEKKNNAGHILYAVAINNTSSEAAKDRYVASTYDITVPAADDFHPATETELDNNVKLWSVSTMTKNHPVTLGNVRKTAGSNSGTPVSAKNGETIKISFNHLQNKVKYFYVVRDDSHVDENTSGSSAINAWKSYKYEGNAYGNVVEVDPSDPTGELKITINGTVGDEIGFRLFAMNYNGTLTPVPANGVGGKGFVVYVGADQSQTSVAGSLTAAKANGNSTGWLAISGKLKGTESLPTVASADVNGKTINFTVQYSKDGNSAVTTTGANNTDIKFVKFTTATAMADWKDDAKANFVLSTKNTTTGMVENEISVSLTKVLPDVAYTKKHFNYTWKDEQLVDNKYKAYVTPVATVTNPWSAPATEGYQKLTQAITGLNTTVSSATPEVGFHINVDGIKKNATTNKWEAVDFTAADSWKVTVPAELIDGTTEHKTTISYNYGKVSSDKKDDNGNYVLTLETVQTVFACPLTDAVQKYTWKKYNEGTTDKPVWKDVNYLTYNNPYTLHNVNLMEYILGTNDYYNNEFGGTLYDLVYVAAAEKYVSIKDVKLVSDQSDKQDYFKVTGYSPITFTVNSEASNPVKDVKSWLKFTVVDAFGHEISYKMPFTVKRAQAQ